LSVPPRGQFIVDPQVGDQLVLKASLKKTGENNIANFYTYYKDILGKFLFYKSF
jgi:hypothetical protein